MDTFLIGNFSSIVEWFLRTSCSLLNKSCGININITSASCSANMQIININFSCGREQQKLSNIRLRCWMLTGEDDYNGVEPAQYDYEEMLTNLQQKRWHVLGKGLFIIINYRL